MQFEKILINIIKNRYSDFNLFDEFVFVRYKDTGIGFECIIRKKNSSNEYWWELTKFISTQEIRNYRLKSLIKIIDSGNRIYFKNIIKRILNKLLLI